jgi:hypothetical protein
MKSPFEKITRLNAPGVDDAVKMPIEKGFNDNAGKRIAMESLAAELVKVSGPGTPVDKVPKPIDRPKPMPGTGKPIIKPVPPKPGVPKPPIKPIKPTPVRPGDMVRPRPRPR